MWSQEFDTNTHENYQYHYKNADHPKHIDFTIDEVVSGNQITATVIGYESQTLFVDSEVVNFELNREVIEMNQLEVLASRAGEKTAVVIKTIAYDVTTTSELGAGKRRVAHVLGMWGTILFWIASVVMIFCYTSVDKNTPTLWPMMWHIGAIMTCVGGYWFWLFC